MEERRSENMIKGWMSSESPNVPVCPLYTSVCSSQGGIAIADATGRVCAHLSPPHRNICLLTQAICLVTQALSRLHPPVSLSCLFFSFCPHLVAFDGVPGAGRGSCMHGFMGTLSPSAALCKQTPTYTHALERYSTVQKS